MADVRSQMSDVGCLIFYLLPLKTLRYTEEFSVLFCAFSKGVLRTVAIKYLQIIAIVFTYPTSDILHQTSAILHLRSAI